MSNTFSTKGIIMLNNSSDGNNANINVIIQALGPYSNSV